MILALNHRLSTPIAFIETTARALAFALQTDLEHQLYLGVDEYPAPAHEVRDWLADQLQVDRPPRNAVPGVVGSKRCVNARISRRAGYRFVFPTFREGFVGVLDSKRLKRWAGIHEPGDLPRDFNCRNTRTARY